MTIDQTDSAGPSAARLWQFTWRWLPGREATADSELMIACADLYSREYGIWGVRGPHPGQNIRISPEHVSALLDDDTAWLACAFHADRLIGYCAILRLDVPALGRVDWVTQLVVESSFRKARVATTLLYGVWQFSDCYAWGLATANPYAVRALETATRRTCRLATIRELGPPVLQELSGHVDYLPAGMMQEKSQPVAKIDTRFYIDLSNLPRMKRQAARKNRRWNLGDLVEGQEWFACTFASQAPVEFDAAQLDDLLHGADDIWVQAYEGMTLTEGHRWRAYSDPEVNYVLSVVGVPEGGRVLDVGCGDGRHSFEMAKRGYSVVGIDIAPLLIERAASLASASNPRFLVSDARKEVPEGPFDLALCLYDVLGSSASSDDDLAMLKNIYSALVPNGFIVATVMNTAVTLSRLDEEHRPSGIAEFVQALEALSPSQTMQTTGLIFDPELVLYFDGIYYRKEQFDTAGWRLPVEYVVRDKRYDSYELGALFEEAGFELTHIQPVQLGHWDQDLSLDEEDDRAKELLVVARRP